MSSNKRVNSYVYLHYNACGLMMYTCLQEYPFFTVKSVPPGFVLHLGGVVSARSVKLLDKIHNPGINFFLLWQV